MARPALHQCPVAGCRELTRERRCGKHAKEKRTRAPDRRGSSTERGYDYQWQKLRLAKLRQDPLCADCLENGRTTGAEEVHHRAKVADEPQLRLDMDNLMSLCKPCHSVRTARGE
jgi:5-methylcytosine-specific restriction protein A